MNEKEIPPPPAPIEDGQDPLVAVMCRQGRSFGGRLPVTPKEEENNVPVTKAD